MNTPNTVSNENIYKTTIYNASCGVLGNIIYDTGREMPSYLQPASAGFFMGEI
jgi:hypothetical protein